MKSRKKLVIAGCAVAFTLSSVVIISTRNNDSSGKLVKTEKNQTSSSKNIKGVKSKPTVSAEQVKLVYEAIKNNQIEVFEKYLKAGGTLTETVQVDNKEMTLAEVIVKHERLEFIHKAATTIPDHTYEHEVADIREDTQAKSHLSTELAAVALQASASNLAPIINAVAKMGNPKFKKDVLSLSKNNPEVLETAEVAASEILPEIVSTCDQDQIRFLGDLGANPMAKNDGGENALDSAGKSKCLKAITYWKKEQHVDFDKPNEDGVSGFDVLSKFKDPELQSFTDNLQDEAVREVASLKTKSNRVSFYKKRSAPSIIDPEALVEPELRPDEATETAEFSEFSD